MVIGILQPGYLPWLGFFEQLYRSDVFVILDDVQYDKQGWRNRNRIKTANGVQWLTVPVLVNFSQKPLICEVKIDNKPNWRKKHLETLRQSYAKAPFYRDYIELFQETYSRSWEYLVDLDMHFIEILAVRLGLKDKKIVRSSNLDVGAGRIDRLVGICRAFQADVFYEGASGRNYIDEERFVRAGIKVEYQDYRHPGYRQLHEGFVPNLSVVDLLFNHGPESLSILTSGQESGGTS